MAVVQRVVKPTTHRTKRILKNKEPKLIENVKQTLFIRGRKTHDVVLNCMKDMIHLKKPHCLALTNKHDILPFEDFGPVEKLCQKHDASLFVFGSHNKKRPNNLIIGRTFDHHLLDAFELGIDHFESSSDFSIFAPSIGIKPSIVFIGEEFETIHSLKRLKSLLIDLFHQKEIDVVHLPTVEYAVTFSYVENKILLRTYRILMKNIGEMASRVELENMGPFVNFTLRRQVLASNDLFKKACAKPKTKGKKIQNIKRDAFGSKLGRVHMTSQNIQKLQTRKMKGLKKTPKERKYQNKKAAVS